MEVRHSGNTVRHGSFEFAAVRFGESEALSAVAATLPDGRGWIVSPSQTRIGWETIRKYADALRTQGRRLAAAEACQRFLGEILAYVRALPPGRRSDLLTSADPGLSADAEAEVMDALLAALERDDPYRAAVEFETRVPYLVADRELIEVMDHVHAAFMRGYDEDAWIAAAAEATEEALRRMPFASSQIAAWKAASGVSTSLPPR